MFMFTVSTIHSQTIEIVVFWNSLNNFFPLSYLGIQASRLGCNWRIVFSSIKQEKYWEDHPGEAVPLMKPKFYSGPWKILRGEVPT
jgi:hypothetical protein